MISPDIASQWSSLNTTAPAAISQRTVRDITLPTVRLPTALGVARAELRRCIVRDVDVEPLLARHETSKMSKLSASQSFAPETDTQSSAHRTFERLTRQGIKK